MPDENRVNCIMAGSKRNHILRMLYNLERQKAYSGEMQMRVAKNGDACALPQHAGARSAQAIANKCKAFVRKTRGGDFLLASQDVCAPSQTSGVKKTLSSVFFTLPTMPLISAAAHTLQICLLRNGLCLTGRDQYSMFSCASHSQCYTHGFLHRVFVVETHKTVLKLPAHSRDFM